MELILKEAQKTKKEPAIGKGKNISGSQPLFFGMPYSNQIANSLVILSRGGR